MGSVLAFSQSFTRLIGMRSAFTLRLNPHTLVKQVPKKEGSMSEISVGKEVLSYCSKCKLTLAHLVVAMKSPTQIGKVTCKTCKGTHAYKDPSAVSARKTKSRTSTKKTAAKTSVSDMWMDAMANSKTKSLSYSTKTNFTIGDIIDHPKFGPGVVEKSLDGNKVQVIFRHEIKVLIHNR